MPIEDTSNTSATWSETMWDKSGEHYYECGCDHGMFYDRVKNDTSDTVEYKNGVVWNGLSQISESPSGGDENKVYADNIKYLSLRGTEDFGCTIECYQYPPEFDKCNGIDGIDGVALGQQARQSFGFSYRTRIGNDVEGDSAGYKIHIIYGATASPSERSYATVNDSPEAATMSFECSTVPEVVGTFDGKTYRPTAQIVIDSRKVNTAKLDELLEKMYGDKILPLPAEILAMLKP